MTRDYPWTPPRIPWNGPMSPGLGQNALQELHHRGAGGGDAGATKGLTLELERAPRTLQPGREGQMCSGMTSPSPFKGLSKTSGEVQGAENMIAQSPPAPPPSHPPAPWSPPRKCGALRAPHARAHRQMSCGALGTSSTRPHKTKLGARKHSLFSAGAHTKHPVSCASSRGLLNEHRGRS